MPSHRGPRRYEIINALLLGAIYSSFVFCRNFFAVTSEAIRRDSSLNVRTSDISTILVAAGVAFGVTKAGIGVLIDCIGDGRIALWIFMVGTSLCTIVFAEVRSVNAMLIIAAVNAIFQAGAYPAASKVIYEMYPESMWGRMVSVLSIGSRVGALLTSVVLGLVLRFHGNDWRAAVRVAPIPVGVIFVVSIAVLCRSGMTRRRSVHKSGSDGALSAAADGGMYRVESLGLLPPARAEDASSVRDDGAEDRAESGGDGGEAGAGAHGSATERELDLLTAQLAGPSPATVVLAPPTPSKLGVLAPLTFRAVVVPAAAVADGGGSVGSSSSNVSPPNVGELSWSVRRGGCDGSSSSGCLAVISRTSAAGKITSRVRRFVGKIRGVVRKPQFWYVSGASGCLLISKGFEAFGAMYIGDVVGADPSISAIAVASIPAGIVVSVLLGGVYIESLPPRRKARWTVALSILNVCVAALLAVVTSHLERGATFDLLAGSLHFDVNPHLTSEVDLDLGVDDAGGAGASGGGAAAAAGGHGHHALRSRGGVGGDLVVVCALLFLLGFSSGYGFYVPSSMCVCVWRRRECVCCCCVVHGFADTATSILSSLSLFFFYFPCCRYALRSGGSESATVIGMSEMVQAALASSFVLLGGYVSIMSWLSLFSN